MKKITRAFNILLPVMVLVFAGCTDNFEEINSNPNVFTTSELDESLLGPAFSTALYKGIHHGSGVPTGDDQGTYGLITMLHSMTFTQYTSAFSTGWTTERNGVNDGWRERGWLRFYTQAYPALKLAHQLAEGQDETLAVLDIWKVFMMHQMTDHWGAIPYSNASEGGDQVVFDSQEEIYADFFELLNDADSTLQATSQTQIALLSQNDLIYQGDIEKWRKFGNSLRLRLAMRISDIDPAKAQLEAESAVASGVITSNEEAAIYQVSEQTPNNLNMINVWGFGMSASMESILEGYNDPRMQIWFDPSPADSVYRGQPSGGAESRDWSSDMVSTFNQTTYGDANSTVKNIEVLTAAEVSFIRAEGVLDGWVMGGDAKTFYDRGIELSMSQWEITDAAEISDYINGTSLPVIPDLFEEYVKVGLDATPPVDVPVAFAADEEDQRTQIAVQKYLALFPESWETWADLRRSDADILYPRLNTDDLNVGLGLMSRLIYVPNSYNTNLDEVNKAVQLLAGGQDVGNAKVWWDVN